MGNSPFIEVYGLPIQHGNFPWRTVKYPDGIYLKSIRVLNLVLKFSVLCSTFPKFFSMSYVEDWWIASNFELEGSMKAVLSALTVTALAFVLIFGLDKVAEAWP